MAEEPEQSYWSFVEPVWLLLNMTWDDGPEEFVRQFRLVIPKVGHLYAAHWCQSEVRNGGFHQFFYNTTGILAPEALEGFRAIGLTTWTAALAEAMRFFGRSYPRERAKRMGMLPEFFSGERERLNPFDSLDERFYAWSRREPDPWETAADYYARTGTAWPGDRGNGRGGRR